MGNLLYYSDINKIIEDIAIQPDAYTISDFIKYWNEQFSPALGEGFLYTLQKAINEIESRKISDKELRLFQEFELLKLPSSKNPNLRFAKWFIESLILETIENNLFGKKTSKKNEVPSFNLSPRHKDSIKSIVEQLNFKYQFLSLETSIADFIELLLARDLRSKKYFGKKVVFGCTTQTASYILYQMKLYFNIDLARSIFDKLGLFFTKGGEKALKFGNLSKSNGAAEKKHSTIISDIDKIFLKYKQ